MRPASESARIMLVVATSAFGGMETHCIDLAAEFIRRGSRVAAIIPSSGDLGPLEARFRGAGAEVMQYNLDARQGRAAQIRDWPRLVRDVRAWRPDVVHVHSGGPSGGVALVAAARMASQSVVVLTEHNAPSERTPRAQRVFRRWMDRWSDAVIAVSRLNAEVRTRRIGSPRGKFVVVLNGVPVFDVSSELQCENRKRVRSQLAIDPSAVLVGSVVRLVDGKGLDDLLGAVSLVNRQLNAALLLVGSGPLQTELEALSTRLGIRERVYFSGHQDEPAPYVDALDVFVLPVPVGSMSIALLEAMSRGVASAITFCGPEGSSHSGKETGLCAPRNDPAGLASVLERAIQDPMLRARLGSTGAAHVARHFSVGRVADDLLEIYAAARSGQMPRRLRADAPPSPRPGDRNDH